MDVCLRELKESGLDSYNVRNSVPIISHITFRIVACTFFPTSFFEIAIYYELIKACSPVDLISLTDRALRPFIAKVSVPFPVKP